MLLDLKTVQDIAEGLFLKQEQDMDSSAMMFSGYGAGNYAVQLTDVVYVEVDKFFFVKLHLYYKNPNYNPNANPFSAGRYRHSHDEYTYTKFQFFDFRGPFSPIFRYIRAMFFKKKKHEQDKERVRLMENVNQALNLCGLKLEKDLLNGGKK